MTATWELKQAGWREVDSDTWSHANHSDPIGIGEALHVQARWDAERACSDGGRDTLRALIDMPLGERSTVLGMFCGYCHAFLGPNGECYCMRDD